MELRTLGKTGIQLLPVAFGAGPVSQLLVQQERSQQRATIEKAVELGVRWFDTAATYGNGGSEESLGLAFEALGIADQVCIATKVRIMPSDLHQIAEVARASVASSLRRLRVERISLLQVHNSITAVAGDEPTSLSPAHVLAPGGLLETFDELRREGFVEHFGLTGLGQPAALREVIDSGQFATIQTPYHLLNPSAGMTTSPGWNETNYGNIMDACQRHGMGVFAIRVLAGGALAGKPPSPHTLKTPFFPLELFQRDQSRAGQLYNLLPPGMSCPEVAIRFAISHPYVTSAIVGFASPQEVEEIVRFAYRGPLEPAFVACLAESAWSSSSSH
jgi:aryl-alcohol dehydrogenase-like predicted oxidoreductase